MMGRQRGLTGFGLAWMALACQSPVSVDDSMGSKSADTAPVPGQDSAQHSDSAGNDTHTGLDSGDAPEPEPEPVNALIDPGFEENDGAWSIWGGAERVEGEANTGSWSLQATRRNGAEQRVEGLLPNTVYRLSGWVRADDSQPMAIGVKDHGNDEQRVTITSSVYTQGSLEFTTGLGTTSAIVYAYKHMGDGSGYADDLWLEEVGPSDLILVWSDEFDGSGALDDAQWGYEEGFVRNEELQWYQPDNAFQEDGVLVIEGRTEDRPNPNYVEGSTDWKTSRETIEYTSASVNTSGRFEWQYGRMSVRAKVTNFTGTWPAIWTLGTTCEWPSNGEVDIMENYGGNILANFAWGTDRRWSPEWDSSHWPVVDFGTGWTDAFHIWELLWTESKMTIFLDGQVLNEVSLSDTINGTAACEGQNPFQQPHYLLLNLALGGSAGGSVEKLDFPTRYVVDYVRIYQ